VTTLRPEDAPVGSNAAGSNAAGSTPVAEPALPADPLAGDLDHPALPVDSQPVDSPPAWWQVGRSTWTLMICQALFFAGISIDLTLTGIVGLKLAPSPALATLPLAMITIVGTAGSVLTGLLVQRFGYPAVVAGGSVAAVVGGGLSVLAVQQNSFLLLCIGTGVVGLYRATGSYIRYMAADSAPDGQRQRALSFILAGGLIAAFVGPLLATRSAYWFSDQYAGSYAMIAVLAVLSIPLILTVKTRVHVEASTGQKLTPVPIRDVQRSRTFLSGLLALAISGGVMTMIMAIGPIGSQHAGHSLAMGASIIQWHLVAMFAPSVFTGVLLERIGTRWTAWLGALILAAGALAGVHGDHYSNFLIALVLNGLGWNFLYTAGSAMMIECYAAGRGGRIQAVAEGVASGTAVLSSLTASAIFYAVGWRGASVAPLVLGLLLALWFLLPTRRTDTPALATAGSRS
jgi:MFS family permease